LLLLVSRECKERTSKSIGLAYVQNSIIKLMKRWKLHVGKKNATDNLDQQLGISSKISFYLSIAPEKKSCTITLLSLSFPFSTCMHSTMHSHHTYIKICDINEQQQQAAAEEKEVSLPDV